MVDHVSLREKFFGCIAGCHIGSAMGAPVEHWTYQRIENEYGTLDKLVPYEHIANGWMRDAGTTEDGVERQKLMITAIIEKQDRVSAEDIRKIWVRDIKPEAPGMVSEPFEAALLAMARTPIPATDLGKYCDYSGLGSFARASHPIGLINAGDIEIAIRDVNEIGQLYLTANSRGVKWAEVVVVGIAEALRSNATVDSVIGAVFDHCDTDDKKYITGLGVIAELERGLKLTSGCNDFRELRKTFDTIYSGMGMPYPFSFANEVVTKAICVFRMVKGNVKEAIIASVNMGRDTDCLAAIAAGISGALTGGDSVPRGWIDQVDDATRRNVYTNSQRTMREASDGLYGAFKSRLRKLRRYAEQMDE